MYFSLLRGGRVFVGYSILILFVGFHVRAADIATNFFTGNIALDGDISDFFTPGTTNLLPGVCLTQDPATEVPGRAGTAGLGEAPLAGVVTREPGTFVPSGFNQRRILTAYNPFINGGTIFVGIDLPGGVGSPSNPTYSNNVGALIVRGQVRPFDADGNGDPEMIGTVGTNIVRRCTDLAELGFPLTTSLDIIDCAQADSGGFTDAVTINKDPGNKERYALSVTFGGGTQLQVELFQDNTLPSGQAAVSSVITIPAGRPFGARASISGGGSVLGFDVEFAITNVIAAVPDECGRLAQTIRVASGSLQDGTPNGEDFNVIECIYSPPPCLEVTKLCPATPTPVGGLLTFSGTVSNCGLVSVVDVFVTNTVDGITNFVVAGPFTLGPGAVQPFTGTYRVPAGYTNCAITDILTASGRSACTNTTALDTIVSTCPVSHTPCILVTQACPPAPVLPGGLFTFTGSVSNCGTVTLTNVVVSNLVAGVTNFRVLGPITLASGAVSNFTASYTVPIACSSCDITGSLVARGTDVCVGSTVSNTRTTTCPLTNPPCIRVTQVCPTTPVAPGGLLTFSGVVSNCGPVTLTNVLVTNFVAGVTNARILGPITLLCGESAAYTASYFVPSNCNVCDITETVTARGTDVCRAITVTDTAVGTCPITNTPAIRVTQTCPPAPIAPGGLLTYSGSVSNAGRVTLTNVLVTNFVAGVTNFRVLGPITLECGQVTNFTVSYFVPTNCSTCDIAETLSARGTDICRAVTVSDSVIATCPLTNTACLRITQTCPPTPVAPGGLLTFSATVSNCGTVTLTNVLVTNFVAGVTNFRVLGPITLACGQSTNFTGSYVVPIACSSCDITGTLSVRGTDICRASVTTDAVITTCPLTNTPCIRVTQVCPSTPVVPGGLLTFSGTVSNCSTVTLTNVLVTNFVAGVTNARILGPITLLCGESVPYTASYFVPSNCNVCDITETVTARGTDTCRGLTVLDTAVGACPVSNAPAIRVTQTCPTLPVPPGGLLTFSGSVSNSGRVTLTNVVVTNFVAGVTNFRVLGPITLDCGAVSNFTVSYFVPTNCSTCDITETLFARGTDICKAITVTDSAAGTCPVTNTACVTITQSCPPTPVAPGGLLTISGTISNCGTVTLTNVLVTNFVAGVTNYRVIGPLTLLCGQSVPFTTSYIVPFGCSLCAITETLSVRGTDICRATTVTDSTSGTCPVTNAPCIEVTRVCPTTPVAPGGLLTFSGIISNCSSVTLTNVVVTNFVAGVTNARIVGPITLLCGQSVPYTASYFVPTNCNVCDITETVTAYGTDICRGLTAVDTAAGTCQVSNAPSLRVTQTCPPAPTLPGGLLTFSGSVSNSGRVTLTNVVVSNLVAGVTNFRVLGPIELDCGEVTNFTVSYFAPTNCSTCSVTETLSARGADICRGITVTDSASGTCLLTNAPCIRVTQSCPPAPVLPGGLLTFTGSVSNCGTVTLTNVLVTNFVAGVTNFRVIGPLTLACGESVPFTGSYFVPTNCNIGSVASTISARGTDVCRALTATDSASGSCPVTNPPCILVTQLCPAIPPGPGNFFTFTGSVSNCGRVTLTNVTVTNFVAGVTNFRVFGPVTLECGQVSNFTASYRIPLDYAGCDITGTVTARGVDVLAGTAITSASTRTCPLTNSACLEISQICPPATPAPGALLTFSCTVSNCSGSTITNILVTNTVAGITNFRALGPFTLAGGAATNFSISYTVPLDYRSCAVSQTVSVLGADSCLGRLVADASTAPCSTEDAPCISVTKVCPPGIREPGQLLNYSGVVSNCGIVTLTNVFVVNDQPLPNTPVIGPLTLLPGQFVHFAGSYVIPTNGLCESVDTLTARGTSPCGSNVFATATARCPVRLFPCLAVVKICPTTPSSGGMFTFSGYVTNIGNATVTNIIVVNDQPVPNTFVIGPITLAPGQAQSFGGSYPVPAYKCEVTDTLVATGTSVCGERVVHQTTETCPVGGIPLITVSKFCPTNPIVPGQWFSYWGTISNAGSVVLRDVVVYNDYPAPQTKVLGPITLQPGQTSNYWGGYTIPWNASCEICDIVTVCGMPPCGPEVHATNTMMCPITTPQLTVLKQCPPTPTLAGQPLIFSGIVSNSGSIALTNVVVVNNQPNANTPVFGPVNLNPGQWRRFTNSYLTPPGTFGPYLDVLTGRGVSTCGDPVIGMALATCQGSAGGNVVRVDAFNLLPDAISELRIIGEIGRTYDIEASGDLNQWMRLISVLNSGGLIQFVDPARLTNAPQCFYRAVLNPNIDQGTGETTLEETINPQGAGTTAFFQWGANTDYGYATDPIQLGSGHTPIKLSVNIQGLLPSVIYHYRIVLVTGAGVTYGSDRTFSTPGAPVATTTPATGAVGGNAVLQGIVNPHLLPTVAWFEWGSTLPYSQTTARQNVGSGFNPTPVLAAISGLTEGLTYHFRVVASNALGVARGNDQTFATTTPRAGSALSLDGLNDYVNVPNSPSLAITGPVTLEAWVNRSSTGVQHSIIEKYGCNNVGGYILRVTAENRALFGTRIDCNIGTSVVGGSIIPANVWTHLAGVFDGATLRIYVNGALDATLASTQAPKLGNTPLRIGARGNDVGTPFAGQIDEVRVWWKARSQTEIQQSLHSCLSGLEPGLAGYWPFDEGAGLNAADGSANGNAGALVNGPVWVTSLAPMICGPVVVTLPATGIGSGQATLNGSANPNNAATTGWFEWGPSTLYGTKTPVQSLGSGGSVVTFSAPVTGLQSGVTYHFRAVSVTAGITNYGLDRQFSTALAPAAAGLRFDGINDYVQVLDSPSIRITGPVTIEAWIKRHASGVQHAIAEKYGCSDTLAGGYALRVGADDKLVFWTLDDCNGGVSATSSGTLQSNIWYHIAAVWDGAAIRLYIDGAPSGVVATTHGPKAGDTPLIFGARGNDLATPFNGIIGEIRLWNVARDPSQILQGMNQIVPDTTTGLVGCWRFDDGAGSIVTDFSPSTNHGALVNGPIWLLPIP